MKVPGIGEVKPVYVVGVGAAATGVVIYAYVRKKNSTAVAATGVDPSIDPATGQPYANEIDPATGLPYSQEQGVQDTGAAFTPFGGIDPSTGIPYIDETGTHLGTVGTPNSIQSNQDWANTAQQELENTFGYNAATAQSAVRKYLGQKDSLTATETSAIQTVVAEIGNPPTGGPYRIITGGTSTSGTPGTPGGSSAAGAISNLVQNSRGKTSLGVQWNPARNATGGYSWSLSGSGVSKHGSTRSTRITVGGLKSRGKYNFSVQGLPGGPGNNIPVTTS